MRLTKGGEGRLRVKRVVLIDGEKMKGDSGLAKSMKRVKIYKGREGRPRTVTKGVWRC